MLTQNEAMGAATASDGKHAPIASFWVGIMTSCISIKRGVWCLIMDSVLRAVESPKRARHGMIELIGRLEI